MAREALGGFEQWTLMALVRLKEKAYGRTVHRELEERLNKSVSIGQVYVTLERLQSKGFVESETGGATATRGGRTKRYFSLTGAGELALQESLRAVDVLRPGAEWGIA